MSDHHCWRTTSTSVRLKLHWRALELDLLTGNGAATGEKPSTVAGNFTDNHMQSLSQCKPLVCTF